MPKSLDEGFSSPLDVIVYDDFPGDMLDYHEVKTRYNTMDNQEVNEVN